MKLTDVPKHVVLAAADICDGHSIFTPEDFADVGVPQELIDRHTDIYESDFSNHKYTIYSDDKPVNQVRGVYGLNVLAGMIQDLKITNAPEKMGRGFQAQVWKEAISAHFMATANDN